MTNNDTQGLYHQQQLEQQEYEEWLADEEAQDEYQQYLDNKQFKEQKNGMER